MHIELGKYYRTRAGYKVRIYATDGGVAKPIHGAAQSPEGSWLPCAWTSEGRYMCEGSLHSGDLIEEWVEKPAINWAHIPPWFNFVAMDKDGRWNAFSEMPYVSSDRLEWLAKSGRVLSIPPAYQPQFTSDWTESLVERPHK